MALFVYGRRGKHKYFSLYEKSSTYIYHSRTNPRLVQGIQVILSPDVYHIFPIPRHPEILDEYPWVSGWLDSQEKFLVALADKSGIDINKSGLI